MRIFFATSFPKPIGERIVSLNEPIPGIRWIPESNLHVTLQFVGDVDPEVFERLALSATEVAMAPFKTRLSGVGSFPNAQRPRVVFVGIQAEQHFTRLREILCSTIQTDDTEVEDRPFRPHLSIGRIRRDTKVDVQTWLRQYADFSSAEFEIDSFHLFSSELRPEGAIYRKLKTYPFRWG